MENLIILSVRAPSMVAKIPEKWCQTSQGKDGYDANNVKNDHQDHA
jgi:hypothetical protein